MKIKINTTLTDDKNEAETIYEKITEKE